MVVATNKKSVTFEKQERRSSGWRPAYTVLLGEVDTAQNRKARVLKYIIFIDNVSQLSEQLLSFTLSSYVLYNEWANQFDTSPTIQETQSLHIHSIKAKYPKRFATCFLSNMRKAVPLHVKED